MAEHNCNFDPAWGEPETDTNRVMRLEWIAEDAERAEMVADWVMAKAARALVPVEASAGEGVAGSGGDGTRTCIRRAHAN